MRDSTARKQCRATCRIPPPRCKIDQGIFLIRLARSVWLAVCLAQAGFAQWYAGGGAGISTLSGDARSILTPGVTAISQYKPENGPLIHVFAGRHIREYLSVQAGWSWNRNAIALLSTRVEGGNETTYEQARRSSQQSGAFDFLLYFRGRSSFARPFLSTGVGLMRFESRDPLLRVAKGRPAFPPDSFAATKPGLRVAAGIDLMFGKGWGLRYAFLETIQANPISAQLSPKGQRGMANFQNLFGLVKYF